MGTIINGRLDRNDFFLEIAKGNIAGHTLLRGYGEREDVGTTITGEDVWLGTATTVPAPAAAGEQITFVSTDDEDGGAGTDTGTLTLRMHYLDADGNEQSEDITMSGLTIVNSIATNVRFIQYIHTLTVGSNGVAVGTITAYKFGDAATIYSMIKVGGNMSLLTHRMVPLGKTLYITSFYATSSGKTAQDQQLALRLRSTDHNGNLHSDVFIFKDTCYLKDAASSRNYKAYIKIPPLSVVKVSAWADVGGAEISASWEGILIEG